jgi:division protein CdvB (Snf7/Vps24/ESCRT-III family)
MDKHQQQFKNDIVNASLVLNNQLTRLRMLDKKFAAMDKDLLNQITTNIKLGNNDRAKAIANELSNIRHVQRNTQNISLTLEVVAIRFSTINEFATILETINPTVEMIKDIQKDVLKAVPTANDMLSEMTSVTSDILINSSIKSKIGEVPTSTSVDTESLSILSEVEGMLENEAKAKLPEVPNSFHAVKTKQETDKRIIETNRLMVEG